jgi:hypothetical protein
MANEVIDVILFQSFKTEKKNNNNWKNIIYEGTKECHLFLK